MNSTRPLHQGSGGARHLVRAVLPLLAATAAFSQEPDAITLDKMVVTGSYIPYAADATAVPIKVITLDDIQASGESGDLLEVIRKTVPQFVGNANLGSSNSNISGGATNGGSQIKLRNVQTLVLINGRRAAFAPVSATGGYTFVDVNSIPVSAVERIEVLSDGASATYGSDAVSGVVNIILRNNYQGMEVGGGYRYATQAGHWEERSARFTAGFPLGKLALTVSAEWVKTDPMFQNEREFSFDQTGKTGSFPGVVNLFGILDPFAGNVKLATSLNAPPLNTDLPGATLVANGTYTGPIADITALFNISPYATLSLGNERKAATLMFDGKLAESVHLFGDVLLSNTKNFYQLAAQPIVGMPFASAHVTDFGIGVGITDPDHPQNPFNDYVLVRNRFVAHPRGYYSDNDSLRLMAGIRGQITANLAYETAVNLNRVRQKFSNTHVINRAALAAAIDAGTINLFAYEQPAGVFASANIFGTATSDNRSTLNSWDGRVTGDVPGLLPGGPLAYAFGAEYRKETLSAAPDPGSYTIVDPTSPLFGAPTDWDGATTSDPFDEGRTVKSLFAEVRVPLIGAKQGITGIHELELDVAARYDRYSDTEDPLVPKVQLRYLPVNDEFAIRASYSKSFTAPDLYALFGPSGVGFTDTVIDFQRIDGVTIDEADQAFLRLTTNPNLEPEKATTYSAGIIYSPRAAKGLNVEVNYFSIRQTGVLGRVDDLDVLQDVETNGAASQYADRVRIGGFNGTPITAPGDISAAYDAFGGTFLPVFVTNFNENFVSADQDGVDVKLDYTTQLADLGKLDLGLNGLWFHSFTVEDDQYVGTTNGNAALNGGTIPRWLGNFTASLERGNWQVGGLVAYIHRVRDTDIEPSAPVDSFTRVDLYGRYRFSGLQGAWKGLNKLTLRVGVNNLFNRMPPLAPNAWTDSNADTATYGALGRVIYFDATYKF